MKIKVKGLKDVEYNMVRSYIIQHINLLIQEQEAQLKELAAPIKAILNANKIQKSKEIILELENKRKEILKIEDYKQLSQAMDCDVLKNARHTVWQDVAALRSGKVIKYNTRYIADNINGISKREYTFYLEDKKTHDVYEYRITEDYINLVENTKTDKITLKFDLDAIGHPYLIMKRPYNIL